MLAQGEILALREAAEKAWDDDTCHPSYVGHRLASAGQCYVTSAWLAERLGGSVGQKNGHFFWVSPGRKYGLDLTGDTGPIVFQALDSPAFAGYTVVESFDNPRAQRVAHRANDYFDNPRERGSLQYEADLIGDALPAEEPQVEEDTQSRYFHDDVGGPSTV